jgi:hypothetical protein
MTPQYITESCHQEPFENFQDDDNTYTRLGYYIGKTYVFTDSDDSMDIWMDSPNIYTPISLNRPIIRMWDSYFYAQSVTEDIEKQLSRVLLDKWSPGANTSRPNRLDSKLKYIVEARYLMVRTKRGVLEAELIPFCGVKFIKSPLIGMTAKQFSDYHLKQDP